MNRLRKGNKATIRVMYPDGCRHQWISRDDAPMANDAVKFAAWLRKLADEISETATTDGQCAKAEQGR